MAIQTPKATYMDVFQDQSHSLEDDAFYAELTRQILILTDDHEDEEVDLRSKCLKNVRFQPKPVAGAMMPVNYFSWSDNRRSVVPSWIESLWANNGGGTGVFIPQTVPSNKSRRRQHNRQKKNRGRTTRFMD